MASAVAAGSGHPPLPAIAAPEAIRHLLLDVTRAGERLVAVGARGHVLRSDDGGERWQQSSVPVRSALTAVSFVDAEHGWAVGHDATILATADGGRSWQVQHRDPESDVPLLDVLFVDARRGWAVGNFGLFLETRDGGATWTPVDAPVIADDELTLHAITRLGSGDLLIAGERGRIVRSRDGGRTWKRYRSPDRLTLFGVSPWGGRGALICGLRGRAWWRADLDRGDWTRIDTGSSAALYGCHSDRRAGALLVGADGVQFEVDVDTGKARPRAGSARGDLSAAAGTASGWVVVGEGGVAVLAGEGAR